MNQLINHIVELKTYQLGCRKKVLSSSGVNIDGLDTSQTAECLAELLTLYPIDTYGAKHQF